MGTCILLQCQTCTDYYDLGDLLNQRNFSLRTGRGVCQMRRLGRKKLPSPTHVSIVNLNAIHKLMQLNNL